MIALLDDLVDLSHSRANSEPSSFKEKRFLKMSMTHK